MDHLLIRLGRRHVLIADVCTSDDGHGIGYGILLKRIDRVLWYATTMDVSVFYAREAPHINTAVFRLRSDDVEILPRRGPLAVSLTMAWWLTAPFRYRRPWLWVQRQTARVLLGSFYTWVERSRRVPRRLRRFVLRPHAIYRTLRRANAEYGALTSSAWKARYEAGPQERLREAERAGSVVPRRLRLPEEDEQAAAQRAAALGVPDGARLVTVHVRESGYRTAAGLRQREWDVLRNARVETYLAAFDALVARGFTVVRLGDRTMTAVTMPGVIDFVSLPRRDEWLEAWCVLRSEFLIGCDSGPSWLAFLAGVPVLTVNALHFRDIERPLDRFIPKLARVRETGHTLTVSEMLSEAYLRAGLDTERYEHLDNAPEDIREAALDMIGVVGGIEEISRAQHRFNRHLLKLGKRLPRNWSGLQGIACIRRPRGTLSRTFANRYFEPAKEKVRSV